LKWLLEIRRLKLRLGEFTLGEIFLRLARRDYMVLLGPSGCGKTTLLRAVAGLFRLPPGRLWLEGADIGSLPPHKRGIGYVSQTTDLFPHLSVEQNIGFGLRYLGLTRAERRERVERMAEMLGVEGLLRRNTVNLSGGEGKRVALARGLVIDPRILLLDEPLNGVDHYARAGMFDVLRMIHDDLGTATIHVTHDREEAWAVGGRYAVMRDGLIEQSGTPDELLNAPKTPFVAEFLGAGGRRSAGGGERGQ